MSEPQLALDTERRTYWGMVWRVYGSRRLNWRATSWAILLIFIAVFVRSIASSHPYTVIIDGQREWPLFSNLTRVDWIVLSWGFIAATYVYFFRRIGKRNVELEEKRASRTIALLVAMLVGAILSTTIYLTRTDYLDSRDYHAMHNAGQLQTPIFPPLRWGYRDQEPLELDRTFEFPSTRHWLGTDGNGRDALSRLLWSVRIVLAIGLISQVIALFIGIIYGSLMGYFVGKVDMIGMRFVEIVESIPTLFLLITFIALYGRNIYMLMVILGLTGWTGTTRFVRAEFLKIRNLDYVTAAKATGMPLSRILFRHMLPNGLTPVIVAFTFGVAGMVSSESVLSFLGIGVEPPTASWGSMLNEAGNPAETFRWWLAIAPGLMIFLTVFAYNIIGEGLRDAIDPQLNKTQ